MESFEETRRQVRLALISIAIIVPVGVIGFMVLEGYSFLNAIWLTVITLTTIGYGDIYATTNAGRAFTLVIVIVGLGSFAVALQAGFRILFGNENLEMRQRRRTQRMINRLRGHYIISGEGELVDKTISFLMRRAEARHAYEQDRVSQPFDRTWSRIFGRHNARLRPLRRWLRKLYLMPYQRRSVLDTIVIITQNTRYASHLRKEGLLVVEGDSSDDQVLRLAGVKHAQALMALSSSDPETLLTILSAHSRNHQLRITATALSEAFVSKMLRVGATNIIKPYEVAGQFLNNVTFRPSVNEFFNTILFEQQRFGVQVTQLFMYDDSPWIGQSLQQLDLRSRFSAGVIGVRRDDGSFVYAPEDTYVLGEDEVVLAVTPIQQITDITQHARPEANHRPMLINWQRLPSAPFYPSAVHPFTLNEAEANITALSEHYIICAGSHVADSAIEKLNPERPFVIITEDPDAADVLLSRGFRVVCGSPADEKTLYKAGIMRALAIMIAIEDKSLSVLTTLTSRTLSRRLLITATADTDDMVSKLRRAGADGVISPFRIAAQFLLLATIRPVVSDFLQYVLFNYQVRLETTELYMQDDSPWIGKQLGELLLRRLFNAGVIGIRLANGRFIYNPSDQHVIGEHEILIVTVPMNRSDVLREVAHGSATKRPKTLRREDMLKTSIWVS